MRALVLSIDTRWVSDLRSCICYMRIHAPIRAGYDLSCLMWLLTHSDINLCMPIFKQYASGCRWASQIIHTRFGMCVSLNYHTYNIIKTIISKIWICARNKSSICHQSYYMIVFVPMQYSLSNVIVAYGNHYLSFICVLHIAAYVLPLCSVSNSTLYEHNFGLHLPVWTYNMHTSIFHCSRGTFHFSKHE